jgi:hypothetical protein
MSTELREYKRCIRTFKFLSDIGHLLVDTLLLQFTYPRTSDICNELKRTSVMVDVASEEPYLGKSSHVGSHL